MSSRIEARLMKGVRDFLPADMIRRNYVMDVMKNTFRLHGFLPLETPAIEYYEILAGKYGEDAERLIYRFRDRGDRDLGLRYDLNLPLSRAFAMHQGSITRPFKRYQIQPVWRADKPGKGRFREFFQCDVDIIGSESMLADAEVVFVSYVILKQLGFSGFRTRINSRKILKGIVEVAGLPPESAGDICRSIDKLDKVGLDGVKAELSDKGVGEESVNRIVDLITIRGTSQEVLLQAHGKLKQSALAVQGLEEISEVKRHLESMGMSEKNLALDISLARGLDYYTGPIFETVVERPRIGSITGGGRYDELIGLYSGKETPATGNSLGLERIVTVMEELDMFPPDLGYGIKVLICRMDGDDMTCSLNLATRLRSAGISADLYLGKSKLRGQLGFADELRIPLVVIAGEDERKRGTVTLKDMRKHEQLEVADAEIVDRIREILS